MLDVVDPEEAIAEVKAAVPSAKLRPLVADLSDPAAAQDTVTAVAREVGGIDILVNNAAVNPLASIEDTSLEVYARTQAINATAPVALVQAVVPGMKRKKWGAIVSITSITFNGGWKDFTAYVASKGTLVGFTRSLARELGPYNIRVNAIAPGAIPTPLEKEVWADQLESYERFLIDHQSLKFRGSPQDVAEALRFVVSDRARFMTGQNIVVDGGWWMP